MDKVLVVKAGITAIISAILSALGGYDNILSLLITLMVGDLITGIVYAIMQKRVSSHELRNGIMRKLLIFLVIYVACKVDQCITDMNEGYPIIIGVFTLNLRCFVIVYACLEEGTSFVENLANIGVPVPKWVRSILEQVSDSVNKSTPKLVLKWLKEKLNIAIKDDDTDNKDDSKKDEDTESEDKVEEDEDEESDS